jgi:putative transcription factor
MECEICGAPESGYLILVEGAKLNVCVDCSSSGKLLRAPQRAPAKGEEAATARVKEELEVVDDYGTIIANARKKLGLPLEVLAERINEKLSFLERVEHERTLPDEKVAHKLEKELGIRLLAPTASGASAATTGGGKGGMTLGDILEIQQKKKK